MNRPVLIFTIFLTFGIIFSNLLHNFAAVISVSILIIAVVIFLFLKYKIKINLITAGVVIFFITGSVYTYFAELSYRNEYKDFDKQKVAVYGIVNTEPVFKDKAASFEFKVREIQKTENKKTDMETYMNSDYSVSEVVSATVSATVSAAVSDKASEVISVKVLDSASESITETNTKYARKYAKLIVRIYFNTQKQKDAVSKISYGSNMIIAGTLTKPSGIRNPGGFDYETYLFSRGICAVVGSNATSVEILEGTSANPIIKAGIITRKAITGVIGRSLPEQQAGLLSGILIGYEEGLSDSVRKAFSDAGLTHIMVASGANVAFIMLPFVFIFGKLKLGKRLSNLLLLFVALFFLFITGFSPSVARAVIMASVYIIARIIFREPDTLTSVSFSAMVLLLFNPFLLFDAGFQLSYGATLGMILLYNNINKILSNGKLKLPSIIKDTLAATLAATLTASPIVLLHFNKVSLISIFSNILIVPLLEIVTILGAIIALTGQLSLFLSTMIGYVENVLLTFILSVAKYSSAIPYSSVYFPTPPISALLAYYLFMPGIIKYKAQKFRWPGKRVFALSGFIIVSIFLFPLVPGIFSPNERKGLEVYFIDAGQGDSALIRTVSGRTLLIDGGGKVSISHIGEMTIMPFLYDLGITKLDVAVATHPHADHIEGLYDIVKRMGVDNLITPDVDFDDKSDILLYEELLETAREKGVPVYAAGAGDRIWLDSNTYLNILYPFHKTKGVDDLNNSSLVMKLVYKDAEFLFTGDIHTEDEKAILVKKLNADALKVGSHSSIIPTSEAFLNADALKVGSHSSIIPTSEAFLNADALKVGSHSSIIPTSEAFLNADVLKVAHHGSISSTSEVFLNAVKPDAAVISVGKNTFGHPSGKVLERLEEKVGLVMRTDANGCVIIKTDGRYLRISSVLGQAGN